MTDDISGLVDVTPEELAEGAAIGLSPNLVISEKLAKFTRDAHALGVKPSALAAYYRTSSRANAGALAAAAAEVKMTNAEMAELAAEVAKHPRGTTLAQRNAALARARPAK